MSTRREFLKWVGAGTLLSAVPDAARPAARRPPNIVYILADDLGYGDVSCLNPESKLHTPNIDRLAAAGMRFTDAHSPSAVCTPTRYGILTGRYCWRTRLKQGVLGGFSPHLIDPQRMTVASLLKRRGYTTAGLGKWHLGMDWPQAGGRPAEVDYARPIANGPNRNGFDLFYGISASLDMPPYAFIENDRVTAIPDHDTEGRGMQFWRKGPTAPGFEHQRVLPELTARAVRAIEEQGRGGKPFFLYLALPAPHTPILPTEEWAGKSKTNPYGDFVLQVDWSVGQVLDALTRAGLEENTLAVFASDNGCSPQARFEELALFGHNPSYHFRGAKADIYEGGHRVPFLARWPGQIAAGTSSDETICLTDLMATVAELTGARLPANAGEDSVSLLPALLGRQPRKPLREAVVLHSIDGSFAIRQGRWKLERCPGSGGWSSPKPGKECQGLPPVQLYDLEKDVSERANEYQAHPEEVERLTALLTKYVTEGRSTPGPAQKNDGPQWWRQLRWMKEG